ncbi:MAG: lysostaphin resistance A-like protein, partial [Candidatus Hodarchaeota archaeon]
DLAPIMIIIGATSPSFTAFLLTYLKNGKDGVKQLLKRGVDFKIGKKWYIPIFLIIPTAVFGGFGLSMILTGRLTALLDPTLLLMIPLMFILMFPLMLIGGPLNEEFGWRGYALDRLQTKWNALGSSLILGVIWAGWHLPLFFLPGTGQNLLLTYVPILAVLQMVFLILMTILFTWLHNNTGGSVLVAILFHCGWNTSFNVYMILNFIPFGLTDPSQLSTISPSVMELLSLLIIYGNLFTALILLVIVIFVVLKWGVFLKGSEQIIDLQKNLDNHI